MPTYDITDIGLATALVTHLSLDFPRVEPDGRLCKFIFSVAEDEVRPVIEAYYNRRLNIDARSFEQNRRDLTTRMHQARGS